MPNNTNLTIGALRRLVVASLISKVSLIESNSKHYNAPCYWLQVAKSRDVEVLEGKTQYLEFAGNIVPVTKSGDQLAFNFYAFRENRLPFTVRVKDQHAENVGRIAFMRQPKVWRLSGEASTPYWSSSHASGHDIFVMTNIGSTFHAIFNFPWTSLR